MLLAYALFTRHTQVAKDPYTSAIFGLIGHAGHDVEVYVRMVLALGKLDHICLSATHYFSQSSRHVANKRSQFSGLVRGKFVNCFYMSLHNENEPSWQGRVEGMCHIPELRSVNAVPKRGRSQAITWRAVSTCIDCGLAWS